MKKVLISSIAPLFLIFQLFKNIWEESFWKTNNKIKHIEFSKSRSITWNLKLEWWKQKGTGGEHNYHFIQPAKEGGKREQRNTKIKFRKAFLYLSYIITVSAVARFIPKPPALVDSKKQNLDEFLALNRSIRICLSAPPTFPSILSYCHL